MQRFLCLTTIGLSALAPINSTAAPVQSWECLQAADRLLITYDGQVLTEFVFQDTRILRPYFANVRTRDGSPVTRNHPPVPGVDPDDHDTMHPGVWLAFGDINGADFWRNKAAIEHVRFTEPPTVRGERLTFATECRLVSSSTQVGSLTNLFELRIEPDGWLLIWEATLGSDTAEMTFGDQEEMGFGIRVATALTEKSGGRITSSAGLETARRTWGQAADWCDYSGQMGGRRIGVVAMADPGNFRASWWHNRDYGLMVANPFGRQAMKQGDVSQVTVKRGDRLRLRFGALWHGSPPDRPGQAADAFRRFGSP